MTTEQLAGTTVRMPALGESVDEGTITRWLKQPGDQVTAEEPLVEVATDKVDTEIPSPVTGILQRILAEENDVVAIEGELAIITESGGSVAAPVPPVPAVTVPLSGSTTEKLPRIRRTIAQRMVESLQTAAQLTTVLEVDVTAIARLRTAHKDDFLQRTGIKLSFLPFFAKAASTRWPSTGSSTLR
jgi:2-oxoglutarate dehydrogenase E2 component (dihydrolipoamide succinyltransferase)